MFKFNKSVDSEMKTFTSLMKSDPDKGRELFMMGQEVVSLAANGSYRKFCEQSMRCVSSEGFPSIYFISKAFVASCVGQHLLLAAFVLDNGYTINSDVGPNALLDCLRAENITDDECVPIVEFFHKYQFDFNRQEDKTYLAPIHVAIEKQFVNTLQVLVTFGADVNIVATNDVMPLNLAVSLPDSDAKTQIVDLLQRNGARDTWRKKDWNFNLTYVANTNISAKPSGFASATESAGVNNSGSSKPKFVKFSSAMFMDKSEEEDGGFMFSTGDN
eukprot:gene29457-35556_t